MSVDLSIETNNICTTCVQVSGEKRRDIRSPETGVTGCCEPPWMLGNKSVPLQEQQVFLLTKPSLQPLSLLLRCALHVLLWCQICYVAKTQP